MDRITQGLQYVATAIGTIAGSYAVVKLSLYALAFMTKNRQKLEEAKDGMTHTALGLFIALSAGAFISWVKTI